MLTQCLYK